MHASTPDRPTATREFLAGAGFLGRGLRMWGTSPRLMLLGALPAFIVGIVYLAGIILLLINLETLAAWLTPFATDWAEPWRTGLRAVAGVAVAIAGILVLAYTFVAVTLLVGDPFYERIWRAVEARLGDAPVETQRGILRSVADALRLVGVAVLVALVLLLCGLIPGLGQLIALILGALFGGWILALELTGFAFDARGFTLTQRRRMLRARRPRSLGFGVLTYVLFLIPGAAVIVMPAAVAGAALLSRDLIAAMPGLPRAVDDAPAPSRDGANDGRTRAQPDGGSEHE
ncbi:EI24 domain-containing protein [Cryobacterium sp. TMT1-3]|uniref:EI24 domain-containing protein n=1 Tax=Cryobacterium sp. TMT1-3 TaxID=1259237 RepID=UPI0018E0AB29|nr:EI24 domain-containing protein [Cryobacterium sp. TMT1-3]